MPRRRGSRRFHFAPDQAQCPGQSEYLNDRTVVISGYCFTERGDEGTHCISDVECLDGGVDDELVIGGYDTDVVDASYQAGKQQKQPITLQPPNISLGYYIFTM